MNGGTIPLGPSMRRRLSEFMLVWPLTVMSVAAVALLLSSLVFGAHEVDQRVRSHEEYLVRRGIDGQIQAIETALAGQTVWDEAVARIDNRFDEKWTHDHIAAYLRQSIGTWDYLIVDGADRALWGSLDVAPMPAADRARLRGLAAPIIAEIRQLERQRGPIVFLTQSKDAKVKVSKPIIVTESEIRDGRPYLWIASLVQPDFGAAFPRRPTSAIVIAGGFLTPANVAGLQKRYGLKDLRVEGSSSAISRDRAHTAFRPIKDAPSIVLSWEPERPAMGLLTGSMWTVGLVLLSFTALAAFMFRQSRRAAHSLLEVHRTQGEFLANMSHEIRTPLNGVNALSEALARTSLDARQREMVDTIHGSGVMLNRLLSDILDLARIDAEGMPMECEPFDLGEAVLAVNRLMAHRAAEKGLDLQLDLGPAAGAWVFGDVTRLRQILTNLVSNAIKFTGGGYVKVTVRCAAEDQWRFVVRDTGVGFTAEQQDRIFERFAQADGSVTRRFGGTGLGLAISRQLARKMGGGLDGEGNPGLGAVFTLTAPLPRAPASVADIADVEVPATLGRPDETSAPFRALISDDHASNRLVLQIMLDQMGADVRSTENGLEACEAFEAESFDVILMDMQMPVMDGLTAIRRIRRREQERRLSRTPILLVTANASPEHRVAGTAAGADGFVTKPLSAQTLLAAIVDLEIAASGESRGASA
jgi:signal transduction histidine kinase/CheY-like chemotaxis protein